MSAFVPAFCGRPLDRADHLRTDPEKLAMLRQSHEALLLRLDGLIPETDANGRLMWAPLDGMAGAELLFLGLLDGRATFAVLPLQGDPDPAATRRKTWAAMARLPADELAIYGGARSVIEWHARHRFCAQCGQPTHPAKGGWQRNCPACGAEHYPRVDPVAIMLVEYPGESGDQLLLGRDAHFPPRRYSALAGFVEPGESIEETVAREVFEEAGVRVRDVRYIASQPWPFPSQLMIGCMAFAESLDLALDTTEIEDARWFTRAEVEQAMAAGEDSATFIPPPRQAIAHDLLRWWLEQGA
ncbi:MAG: NAD(+) diphosphatase [Altererythrobacter sp.]|nr:NAD(+) diphosphatase [Altererythrobacter sp.]OJU59560.1 MAG: NADH pyrophosphatase [Altererythrobacter sp. 66-12]